MKRLALGGLLVLQVLGGCSATGKLALSPTPAAPPTDAQLPPAQLLERADQQRDLGRFDQAAGEYQQVIIQYPEAPEARVARYGLAFSAFHRQDWAAARSLLDAFIAENKADSYHGRALFLLARLAEKLGDHQLAIDAYARYEAAGGPLAGYAAIRRAAQLKALGRDGEAAEAYEAGGAQQIAGEQRVLGLQAAIAIRDAAGQREQALADVTAMLGFVQSAGFRPSVLADGAARAQELGRIDEARGWLREIVQQWGGAAEAPGAIDELAALGENTSAYRAGQIAFSHEDHAAAAALLDQALAAGLQGDEAGNARRLRALALRETGDFAGAEAQLTALADEQPDTPVGRQARLDAIQTHGQAGDLPGAIAGYRAFADTYSSDPLAPEALRRVVEIISWGGDPAATANAQLELGQRFPGSSEGQAALHEAALYARATQQHEQGLAIWRMLGDTNLGLPRAEGYYWAARSELELGNADGAGSLFRAAYAAAPNSYYGARAADLAGIEENAGLPYGAPVSAEAEAAGRAWIAGWKSAPITKTLDVAPARDRALELMSVDLPAEALSEWTSARTEAAGDPLALYEVALAAHHANHPYASVTVARALMELAPAEAGDPPVAVRQLLYPAPFAAAVLAECQQFGVDPNVLYGLMRQESIFNPTATSWVGARGLAQVMPETGAGIAANLGVADFHPDDLYNPVVSIRFGAFYIGAQIERMNGSVHAALAGYNGGPGNAERWAGGNVVGDPDAFISAIDYGETRHYVEVVYANYGAYRRLYRR
ncbi:MAG TPA: transglycosylase SLT domain-containing protein [Herpetosiphonaceae bacterium]